MKNTLRQSADEMRTKILLLKEQLRDAEAALQRIEKSCKHHWSDPVSDPIVHPGYHVEASGGGSDYMPAHYVPERSEPRWRRGCALCGKVEETTRVETETRTVQKPRW